MPNVFLSKMEHTTTENPSVLISLKRKRSTDDVTDSAKELKPDEVLEGVAAAELQDGVQSDDRTTGAEARPRDPVQNCVTDLKGNLLLSTDVTSRNNLFYDFYLKQMQMVEWSLHCYSNKRHSLTWPITFI